MSTSGKLHTEIPDGLTGCRILVTRAAEQAEEFSALLRQRGACPVECPAIKLVPPESWDEVDSAICRLHTFDWLVITSVNGAKFFFGRMQSLGTGICLPEEIKVCAVGTKTANALSSFMVTPQMIPDQFTGEGVVEAFRNVAVSGKSVLFPKADGARDLIPLQLASMGASVSDPVVYRNIIPDKMPDEARLALENREIDAVVFSSPSTVRNIAAMSGGKKRLQELLNGVPVVSIGPVTSRACAELGLAVAVEPAQATLADAADALGRYLSGS